MVAPAMPDRLPRSLVDSYEEKWQKLPYTLTEGEESYVHRCEICPSSKDVERFPGGHYLCADCVKQLSLPDDRIIRSMVTARMKEAEKQEKDLTKSSEEEESRRLNSWKNIVRHDYLIELLNIHLELEKQEREECKQKEEEEKRKREEAERRRIEQTQRWEREEETRRQEAEKLKQAKMEEEKLKQEQLKDEEMKQAKLEEEKLKQEQQKEEKSKQEQQKEEKLKEEEMKQKEFEEGKLKQEQLKQDKLKQEEDVKKAESPVKEESNKEDTLHDTKGEEPSPDMPMESLVTPLMKAVEEGDAGHEAAGEVVKGDALHEVAGEDVKGDADHRRSASEQ